MERPPIRDFSANIGHGFWQLLHQHANRRYGHHNPDTPRPTDLVKVYYVTTPMHEAGNVDPTLEDDYMMNGENCRINRADLTLEVVEDIMRIQDGFPPINTIFLKKNGEPGNSRDTTAEFTPSSSDGIPATPDLGSPEKEISPSKY